MATHHRRPISIPGDGILKRMPCLLLLLLLASTRSAAQRVAPSPAAPNQSPYKAGLSPTLTILLVAIIGSFFLLSFFTVYFSCCIGRRSAVTPTGIGGVGAVRSRRGTSRGLDLALLRVFPTMMYSAVKEHKLGKETLECAVCLCEFEDEDILRLLPRCSHVFHLDCVDIWLDTHVTCPVCRCDLAASASDLLEGDSAVIEVLGEVASNEVRDVDLADLVRIGSQRRERSGSLRGIPMISRSREDWASILASHDGRYRLQLPDDIRQELIEAGRLLRSASVGVFLVRGVGDSWKVNKDGQGGGWRSLRLGKSARWPNLWRGVSVRGREAAADRSVSGSSKAALTVSDKESLGRPDSSGGRGGAETVIKTHAAVGAGDDGGGDENERRRKRTK